MTQERSSRPEIIQGVACIIFGEEDTVLLQLRSGVEKTKIFPRYNCAPGGRVEGNELPQDAAERELFEETGLREDLKFVIAEVYKHPSLGWAIHYVFVGLHKSRKIPKCNEGDDMRFVQIKELDCLKIVPGHKKLIQSARDHLTQK